MSICQPLHGQLPARQPHPHRHHNQPHARKVLCLLLTLALWLLMATTAEAVCKRNNRSDYPFTPLSDGGSAQFWLGRINLASTAIQPPGTMLGSAVATAAEAAGINGDTLLWTCDLADADQIYEVFSTNGDDRVGGYAEIGTQDGLQGFYRTWFPGVAIRLTHLRSGKILSRYYQSSKLDTYDVDQAGKKILIRARHLSPIKAEVARVSDLTPGTGTSNWCSGAPDNTRWAAVAYQCTQPNGYLMLRGPGYNRASGDMDDDGEDHAYRYLFFGAANGIAFGMRMAATLSVLPSCVVQNVTPEVVFPPISETELNQGQTRQVEFTLSFRCDEGIGGKPPFAAGTDDNQTAFGLQVSPGALAAARLLGYVNQSQGVRYLLSDNYGTDPSLAKGVGIGLSDAENRQDMQFLSSSVTGQWLQQSFPSGRNAGWYRLGAADQERCPPPPSTSAASVGQFTVHKRLTATLQKLPGQTVTPGRVFSTAYVIVKVQ
ncbi:MULTISPECIES: fimbrial protein [unclassified Herbaspirillum]|uniref:fimbrial protein n=1 Tax=unclassified Herbaspirillum TaxID=2624150 RepID=UPI001E3F1279|nr:MULTISPECIES: fimbrial protein [unclassified Herbaspirillum]